MQAIVGITMVGGVLAQQGHVRPPTCTAQLTQPCLIGVAGGRQIAAAGLAPRAPLIGGEVNLCPPWTLSPEVAIITPKCQSPRGDYRSLKIK